MKRRGTDSSHSTAGSQKRGCPPLHAYQPAENVPSQAELRSSFKERLSKQKQLSHSPGEVDSIDLEAVLDVIAKHDVTFINTQTGSGKSTRVPKAIMEADDEFRVVTTQPRRTATIRLAETVSGMCGDGTANVGEGEVGYWIRGDRRGGKFTRLWYMTSYTLLLHLLNNRMAPPFSHIIIDEFHERQPELEVLVALLKLLLQKPRGKSKGFKLILMSATINADEWEQYFQGLSWGLYSNDTQKYVVHEYYLEEASILTDCALRKPATFNQAVVNPQMHDNSVYVAQQLVKLIIQESELHHSILVFLPGRAAVSKLRRWVEAHLSQRLWPIPWHGTVELSWIKQQIAAKVPGKQKIYLATDVAEVSITLPDVVFVIDMCLVKRPYIDRTEQSTVLFPQLSQQWCSKGSVTQRQGRVGRTQQGFYFSLLPAEYADMLEEYPSPPICNSRLDDLTLHLLHVCASPKSLYTLCKRPPLEESIRVSIRSLMELGALLPTSADDGQLTWSRDIIDAAIEANPSLESETQRFTTSFLGIILQRLPVSVQAGMIIFYGLTLGLETLSIICAAIVQTAIPFVTISQAVEEEDPDLISGAAYEATAQSKERTHRSLEFFCRTSESDLIACIVVYLEWKRKVLAGQVLDQWAEEMCVSLERLVAIDELVIHLHNELRSFFPCQSYVGADGAINDAASLQKQLKVHQPILLWLTCVTFAGNAVKVREVQNESRRQNRESGIPLFLKRAVTHPNTHIPSVVTPWRLGQIVVPVAISINEGRNSVAIQQTMAYSQFLLLLLLLFPVARYSSKLLEDNQGTYRAFGITINGVLRRIRCPATAATLVLEFRGQFCNCVAALKYRRQHSMMDDVSFVNFLQEQTREGTGGHGFSLLRARVDLMTQMWNAMRDPTAMPTEMLMPMNLEEVSMFKPSGLIPGMEQALQDEGPPMGMSDGVAAAAGLPAGAGFPMQHPPPEVVNPQYAYPEYMRNWAGVSGWPARSAAATPQMAMAAAGYGIPMPVASVGGYLVPSMQGHPGPFGPGHAMYMQPHPQAMRMSQPMPATVHADADDDDDDIPDPPRHGGIIRDAYAALRQRGPLVEESSDEENDLASGWR